MINILDILKIPLSFLLYIYHLTPSPTPPETKIAVAVEQEKPMQKKHIIANRILDVLERYRLRHRDGTSNRNEEGRKRFLPIVTRRIEASEPIHMVLPAFPFKSPNNDSKVLGTVPDKGEEIALAHLNGLCKSIKDIYHPGAEVTIASDGIVYNDLLGVSDRDVWVYGQTLRKISERLGFTHIHFIRLRDLLGLDLSEPLTEESYVSQAPLFRDKLCEIHTPMGFDVRNEIAKNEDAAATYRGYIKFLAKDLANTKKYDTKVSKSAIKKRNEVVARKMMARGKAFAAAVQANFGDYVRLSIHPSSGSTKFSISLFPHTSHNMTPWHATTVYGLDGSIATAHLDSLKSSGKHELVSKDDVSWYYREKSYLYDWDDMGVHFEPLYPTGLIITPVAGHTAPSLERIDMDKIRTLAHQNSPIVLRGFAETERDVVISKSAEIGQIVERDQPDLNPKLQMFSCTQDNATSSFSSSRQLFEHLPDPYSVESLSSCAFSAQSTPQEKVTLITPHHLLGTPCLRYQKTRHDHTIFSTDNEDKSILRIIDTLMYDRRVCYDHVWKAGDLVISDPVSTVYTHNNSGVDCVSIA